MKMFSSLSVGTEMGSGKPIAQPRRPLCSSEHGELPNSRHSIEDSMIKRLVILPLFVCAAVLTAGGPFASVVAAQRPDLETQHQRLRPLFELAGVVFTDADERNGRLVVGVQNRGIRGLIQGRLRALGVAPESVDIVESEPIVQVATLRDTARPLIAGVQIRYSNYVCSLGFNAIRNGVPGFVTASHCSTAQGSIDGTNYYQPLNQVPAELVATEIADPAYRRGVGKGCPKSRLCRSSDANFSAIDSTVPFWLGAIARTTAPNNISLQIDGSNSVFIIGGEGAAVDGQTVNKVGRTTGWTSGQVTRTCVNTGVTGSNLVLLCQVFVDGSNQIVAGGDSGSPVFRIEPDTSVTLLGNLWGGNTSGTEFVYSPIANIETELGALTTR
jgi:hypothetical protein